MPKYLKTHFFMTVIIVLGYMAHITWEDWQMLHPIVDLKGEVYELSRLEIKQ